MRWRFTSYEDGHVNLVIESSVLRRGSLKQNLRNRLFQYGFSLGGIFTSRDILFNLSFLLFVVTPLSQIVCLNRCALRFLRVIFHV